jgi:NAD(P)-dependent dehydrogenase (short-subunit alcohol dehydrogenase family)
MVRNRRISLKNAKEMMLEYTAFSFRDPKKAAEMFAEDGAFELPYQDFAPLLATDKKRQGSTGRIVNITSSGAKVAIPLLGAYSASKFGLEGMSDALRRELMLFGIDVVIIEPGTVNTAMYDKGEK